MLRFTLTLISLAVCALPYGILAAKGLLELDEHSFEKILGKFDAALVKFDVAYPYGEKHEAFAALALEARDVDELLIADVNVKDYGEKDNEALAQKYGASKDNFPVVKLFLKGKNEPVNYDESRDLTTEELRKFVVEETGLYLSLPGCVRQLDKLAAKFLKAAPTDRNNIFKEAEKIIKELPEKHAASGDVYKMIMKKIMEKGDQFVDTENSRVKKLLSEKIAEDKKKKLIDRSNILQAFVLALTDKRRKTDL